MVQAEQTLKWKVGREIGIVRQLNHPRINKLLGVVDTPERLFIILQHLPGGSLLDKVRAAKRLGELEAAQLLAQAAEGLIYCHSHQVSPAVCLFAGSILILVLFKPCCLLSSLRLADGLVNVQRAHVAPRILSCMLS